MINPAFRLEKWLWQQKIDHPVILPIVRNELLLACVLLILGVLFFLFTIWLFWFGVGFAIMALTIYSLARFFLRTDLFQFSSALFFSVLIRWSGRLLLTVFLLYVSLVLCAAPVAALVAGLIAASILALVTYAFQTNRR